MDKDMTLCVIVRGSFKEGFQVLGPLPRHRADWFVNTSRLPHNYQLEPYQSIDVIQIEAPEGGIQDLDGQAFLLRGDPILEGFVPVGPFTSIQDATAYGLSKEDGNWWVFTAQEV